MKVRVIFLSVLFSVISYLLGTALFSAATSETRYAQRADFARFLARLWTSDGGLARLHAARAGANGLSGDLWIVDDEGRVLDATASRTAPDAWAKLSRPSRAFEYSEHMAPRGQGAFSVVRLEADPARYLVLARPEHVPVDKIRRALAALVLGLVLLSGLFAVVVLQLFLKQADRKRTEVLEELSHDLRTPLASLRSLVDNLSDEKLPVTSKQECARLAAFEMTYLTRLVDDLFLLAAMSEPGYRPASERVDLAVLLAPEIARCERAGTGSGGNLAVSCEGTATLVGDPQLLDRLFRNALENARRFASSRITITVERANTRHARIRVHDDGPGFTETSLKAFGTKRPRRPDERAVAHELSLGLGGSVMQSIARAHGGSVEASNWRRPDGSIGGAELTADLPIESGA